MSCAGLFNMFCRPNRIDVRQGKTAFPIRSVLEQYVRIGKAVLTPLWEPVNIANYIIDYSMSYV